MDFLNIDIDHELLPSSHKDYFISLVCIVEEKNAHHTDQ